jgi:hypothetical protein
MVRTFLVTFREKAPEYVPPGLFYVRFRFPARRSECPRAIGSGSAGRFREQSREHGAPLIGQNEARPGAVASDEGPHEQVLCGRVSNSRIPPIRIRCKAEKQDSLRDRESGGDRF